MTGEPFTFSLNGEALEALARTGSGTGARGHGAGPGLMNVEQAAKFLACGKDRIYALTSAGRIPHHKDGSRVLFDRGELREFVRAGGAKTP